MLFILVGLLLLAYMAETKQVATYEGVMLAVCGPVVKVLADISIIMYGFGANTAFLVVIGDQLQDCECGGFGGSGDGCGYGDGQIQGLYAPLCVYMFLQFSSSLTLSVSAAITFHGQRLAEQWWMDRRLLISISALLLILPWLWMRRIGVLSYTRCGVEGGGSRRQKDGRGKRSGICKYDYKQYTSPTVFWEYSAACSFLWW